MTVFILTGNSNTFQLLRKKIRSGNVAPTDNPKKCVRILAHFHASQAGKVLYEV